MKKCYKCGTEKDESAFHKCSRNKDGLANWCKTCANEVNRKFSKLTYQRNREKKLQYAKEYRDSHKDKKVEWWRKYYNKQRDFLLSLKKPCAKCGEDRPWVIQFHHIDPATKSYLISASYSEENTLEEVKKCVCLCSNCHDEFHWFYGRHPKNPVESLTEYLGRSPYEV